MDINPYWILQQKLNLKLVIEKTSLRNDMDDKSPDRKEKSASLNKESDQLFKEKRQKSDEDLRLSTNRSVSYYEGKSSKSLKNSETLEEQVSLKPSPSSKTSKRCKIPKCGEMIPGCLVMSGRKSSYQPGSNSGAKRSKSFDSTSNTKNTPMPTRLADPKCSEKASEKCISSRPSTSLDTKCSYDYPQVQGDLTKRNKKSIFVCEYCGKILPCMFRYKEHVRFHTGDKPFGCEYCDKRYFKKDHLVVHVRVHTGERPYVCQYCDRAFSNTSNLKNHSRIHTGEKPYKCTICGRDYKYRRSLKDHKFIHHGKSIE